MRRLISVLAVAAAFLLTATGAVAAGAGAVSYTQTFKDVTVTVPGDSVPCVGGTATVTITYNAVVHVTVLTAGQGAGTSWSTSTLEGRFTVVPDDPARPTYSGHFAEWFGDNDNLRNGTETYTINIVGTGSDGSRLNFHLVHHVTVTATGVTLGFDKLNCP